MDKPTAESIILGQLEAEAEHVDYRKLSNDELFTMLGRALCDVGLAPKKTPQRGVPLSASDLEAKPWFKELLDADNVELVVKEAADFDPWVYGTGETQAAVTLKDIKQFFGGLWRLGRRGLDSVLETLCPELCSSDGSGLKPAYEQLISPLPGNAPIVDASKVIILILAPNLAVPAVALLVAAWLVKVGAGKWCRKCMG